MPHNAVLPHVLNLHVQVGAFPHTAKVHSRGGLFLVHGASGSLGKSVGSKPVRQCNEHRRVIIS